jgi:hypothetical protein
MRTTMALAVVHLGMLAAVAGGQGGWARFTSAGRFSVMYPATWRRIGVSTDRLDIVSSPGGAQGVVIRRGQAEIVVMEIREPSGVPLSEVIDRDNRGAAVLSRRELRRPGAPAAGGCGQLTEVVSRDEIGPGAYNIFTSYYCDIRGRRFSVLLRNWEGDVRRERDRTVALKMAWSLRLEESP